MRGPNKFRQRELVRAIKSAKAAGHSVSRVEIEPSGKVVLHLANLTAEGGTEPSANPWDQP